MFRGRPCQFAPRNRKIWKLDPTRHDAFKIHSMQKIFIRFIKNPIRFFNENLTTLNRYVRLLLMWLVVADVILNPILRQAPGKQPNAVHLGGWTPSTGILIGQDSSLPSSHAHMFRGVGMG